MTMIDKPGADAGLVSSASFFMPEKIVVSHWLGHVPFASWLVDALRPRLVVELGTLHGCSYLTFCQALERNADGGRALAVDTWKGDEHTGFYGDDVFEQLRSYHDPRYGWFSSLVRSTFDEALDVVEDGAVDLLHIDGLHFYDSVRHDFESWRLKLSERAVVLFHDTQEYDRGFGVARLWSELTEEHPGFEFLHDSGLGVLGVGREPERARCRLVRHRPYGECAICSSSVRVPRLRRPARR